MDQFHENLVLPKSNFFSSQYPYQKLIFISRGGKAYQFNEKEKTLRVFLRGRPIVHHTPDDYDPESNAPSPSHQLDLNWVYGYRGKGESKTS